MSNETSQETWNATHAQLLKSVADAQAKLLAAQNETCDRLEALKGVLGRLGTALAELASRQELLRPKSYRTRPKSKRKRHG